MTWPPGRPIELTECVDCGEPAARWMRYMVHWGPDDVRSSVAGLCWHHFAKLAESLYQNDIEWDELLADEAQVADVHDA